MSTPKQKADSLTKKMWGLCRATDMDAARRCALVAVDAIIEGLESQVTFTGHKFHRVRFYEKVKAEIESELKAHEKEYNGKS